MPEEFTGTLRFLRTKLDELPPYNFAEGDVALFATALNRGIANRTAPIASYRGLDFLAQWFRKLGLSFDGVIPYNEKWLYGEVLSLPIAEAKSIYSYFHSTGNREFSRYITKHKQQLIQYLKKQTSSMVIEEHGGAIMVEYIIDGSENTKTNDLSVSRIETIHAFFPHYSKYITNAIMLPFPSEEIIEVSRSDAHKEMSPENITNLFEVKHNQVWTQTIEKNYQESSAFLWQQNILNLRRNALGWCKAFVRLIDSKMENNKSKHEKAIRELSQCRNELGAALTVRKLYPQYTPNKLAKAKKNPEEQTIDSWFTSLQNTNTQLVNLFTPKGDNDRNVFSINAKATYYKLTAMQEAFHEMENKTTAYFNSREIDREESLWYTRLFKNILYYMDHLPIEEQQQVPVARVAVEQWFNTTERLKMGQLNAILKTAGEHTGFIFTPPGKLLKTETITELIVAVENLDFSSGNNFMILSAALLPLADFHADFIEVIAVRENIAQAGFRFKKSYFEAFKVMDETGIEPDLAGIMPYPLVSFDNVKDVYPDLELPEIQKNDRIAEVKVKVITTLWKLTESRKALLKNKADHQWLEELENNYARNIQKDLQSITGIEVAEFSSWANAIVDKKVNCTVEGFVAALYAVPKTSQETDN